MDKLNIRLYNHLDYNKIINFKLFNYQKNFTTSPIKIINENLTSDNCFPFVIENEKNEIIGFFLIHRFYNHLGFSTPFDATFIRAVNIDSKHQGNGYGRTLFKRLPEILKNHIKDISDLYLVVDDINKVALNLYEKAGFIHIATKKNGPSGPERLYYLDLNLFT